jgi:hypothetical protein
MNFEITIDDKKRAGLDGIPEDVETWLLSTFTKKEIMDDPEKVIQCMFEADILKKQFKEFVPDDTNQLSSIIENIFKRQNPQDFYKINKRLSSGSFG